MNNEYTTEECLQEYYDSLEKQLAEKDAMINWLIGKITDFCVETDSCHGCPGVTVCPKSTPYFKEGWRKAAQEAVEEKLTRMAERMNRDSQND